MLSHLYIIVFQINYCETIKVLYFTNCWKSYGGMPLAELDKSCDSKGTPFHGSTKKNGNARRGILNKPVYLIACMVVAIGCICLIIAFMKEIRKDVDVKLEIEMLQHLRKIDQCKYNYQINECDPGVRVRALDKLCEEWYECMTVGDALSKNSKFTKKRAALWAETLGEILNAFINSIKIKTWGLLMISITMSILAINVSAAVIKNLTNSEQ